MSMSPEAGRALVFRSIAEIAPDFNVARDAILRSLPASRIDSTFEGLFRSLLSDKSPIARAVSLSGLVYLRCLDRQFLLARFAMERDPTVLLMLVVLLRYFNVSPIWLLQQLD